MGGGMHEAAVVRRSEFDVNRSTYMLLRDTTASLAARLEEAGCGHLDVAVSCRSLVEWIDGYLAETAQRHPRSSRVPELRLIHSQG